VKRNRRVVEATSKWERALVDAPTSLSFNTEEPLLKFSWTDDEGDNAADSTLAPRGEGGCIK